MTGLQVMGGGGELPRVGQRLWHLDDPHAPSQPPVVHGAAGLPVVGLLIKGRYGHYQVLK